MVDIRAAHKPSRPSGCAQQQLIERNDSGRVGLTTVPAAIRNYPKKLPLGLWM